MNRTLILALAGTALLLSGPALGVQYVKLHEELTVAAMAMDEDLDPADHAADWLRFYMPDLQKRVEGGEIDTGEAENMAAADLRRRAEAFDPAEPLVLEDSVSFRQYDPERGAFELSPLFHERYFAAAEPNARTLPRGYQVLIANAGLADFLPMPPEKAERFKARRMGLRGAAKRRLGARAHFRLVAFQNGHDFQAVLTRLELFESPDRKEQLHVFEETRDPGKLVEERLLSEGVTWSVVENHSFNYRGIRLLALLPENHPEYDDCKVLDERLAGHRQVLCRIEARGRGLAEREERLFVGGHLARVTLHRGKTVAPGDKRQVLFELRRMGLPGTGEKKGPVTWNRRGAVLHFYPDVVEPETLESDTARTRYLVVEAAPFVKLADQAKAEAANDGEPAGRE